MLKELDLHITNRCTSKCQYCSFSSGRLNLEELTFDEIKQNIEDAISLGCEHIHITGGEPLMRADVFDIIEFVISKKLEVRLQTNGTLLNEEKIKRLENIGLKSIMISLDSCFEEKHDQTRGKGTYQTTISAIKSILKTDISLRVNSVITKVNYQDIYKTIKFLYRMGIRNYSAFYFSPIGVGRSRIEDWLSPMEYKNFWNELNKKIKEQKHLFPDMNIIIEKGYADWKEASRIDISDFSGCGGGCMDTYKKREYLILRSDGNVYPCIMAIDDIPLGNVRQTSLKDIYQNSPEWTRMLLKNDPECINCEHFRLCGEGCRFYPNTGNNSKTLHDHRCIKGRIVPLCPIMKYNMLNERLGGSSDDVME